MTTNNEDGLLKTPNDILTFVSRKKEVARVHVLEFLEQPAIVIKVKLKFFERLHCLFCGDYKDQLEMYWQMELESIIPSGIQITVLFVL